MDTEGLGDLRESDVRITIFRNTDHHHPACLTPTGRPKKHASACRATCLERRRSEATPIADVGGVDVWNRGWRWGTACSGAGIRSSRRSRGRKHVTDARRLGHEYGHVELRRVRGGADARYNAFLRGEHIGWSTATLRIACERIHGLPSATRPEAGRSLIGRVHRPWSPALLTIPVAVRERPCRVRRYPSDVGFSTTYGGGTPARGGAFRAATRWRRLSGGEPGSTPGDPGSGRYASSRVGRVRLRCSRFQ